MVLQHLSWKTTIDDIATVMIDKILNLTYIETTSSL